MGVRTATILAAFALAGCGAPDPAPVVVEDPLVTLPAVPRRPGAAYFTLETSREGVRLVGVASPKAGRIEIHESGMRPVGSVSIPPGEALAFAPGGRHLMVYDLEPSLRPGARIPLIFTFEGAPAVTTDAEVRGPGDVHSVH
ncbi:copper chaperone PCu(A)C [Allosphingosinicella sp.]|jgi:hypothetical protein|uniref:copper chaperone PCu(A)C n=1 Tax=Allosphingosinicella sp. TaxID=2823234 RepID=UPI002EFDA8DF